jgi:cytochrome c oxidase subunit 1
MLFALGMVFVFGLGGLTGLLLGTISTDIYLHDTMYVVGHFHLTMAAASFLASFAALYFWFPKMTGKLMDETLGKVHFWGSVVFITLTFGGQLIAGYSGQHRRLYDPFQYDVPEAPRPAQPVHELLRLHADGVPAGVHRQPACAATSPARRRPRTPGRSTTLEWTNCASPPVYHNFDVVPTVLRGPHEYANPDAKKFLGRDYLNQVEPHPTSADEVPVAKKAAVGA